MTNDNATMTTTEATTSENSTTATKLAKQARAIKWGKMQLDDVNNPTKFFCAVCNEWHDIAQLDSKRELPNAKRTGKCPTCYQLAVTARKSIAAERKAAKQNRVPRPMSAFAHVRKMLENANLDDAKVAMLTTKQKGDSLAYPLLKEVDLNVAFKDAAFIHNKARYSRKTITINGKDFYITNDIYKKNVDRIRNQLVEMSAIDPEVFPLINTSAVATA